MFFIEKRFVVLFLIVVVGKAEAANNCGLLKSYKEVVSCVETNSPEVLQAQLSLKEKSALTDVAEQLQNPELSLETLSGTVGAEKHSETDLALSFPVELGGKRSARKTIARAQWSRAEVEVLHARSEARKIATLKLLRLQQIEQELELINESYDTFSKLVKQYEARPALAPEQEVALTVYKVAKGEYSFKKIEYDEERSELANYFKIATGLTLAELKKLLPGHWDKWPPILSATDFQKSPLLALYQSDVEVAKSELDLAQGEAWPTMMVGPSAKFSSEAGKDLQQWGVNLSMPLPIFNINGGGKAAASVSVQRAEQRQEWILNQVSIERETLEKSYRQSIAALQETPNIHALQSKHKRIENFVFKGLIPSSMVIEVHRSLVDFERIRNGRVLKAVETLLNIQFIDGQRVGLDL